MSSPNHNSNPTEIQQSCDEMWNNQPSSYPQGYCSHNYAHTDLEFHCPVQEDFYSTSYFSTPNPMYKEQQSSEDLNKMEYYKRLSSLCSPNDSANEAITSPSTTPSKAANAVRHPKPPYSFISLICMAINSSPGCKATLREIIHYIQSNYPYYSLNKRWHGSIRHNLTINDCFVKTRRRPGDKGCPWTVDPTFKDMFSNGSLRRRSYRFKEGSAKWKQAVKQCKIKGTKNKSSSNKATGTTQIVHKSPVDAHYIHHQNSMPQCGIIPQHPMSSSPTDIHSAVTATTDMSNQALESILSELEDTTNLPLSVIDFQPLSPPQFASFPSSDTNVYPVWDSSLDSSNIIPSPVSSPSFNDLSHTNCSSFIQDFAQCSATQLYTDIQKDYAHTLYYPNW